MTTRLDGALRRELTVNGEPYTLTIEPAGFKLVAKGRRKGFELTWESLISGEAALATALNASVHRAPVLALHATHGRAAESPRSESTPAHHNKPRGPSHQ
jgi:hypothetical protein